MDSFKHLLYSQKCWMIDREYLFFHIAINHPNVNNTHKESWKR
ncbi:hypothetical protein VPH166E361_0201 [Vibrio phage 166E36-1]